MIPINSISDKSLILNEIFMSENGVKKPDSALNLERSDCPPVSG
ncbi:MAG: hypothetical protein ACI88A_004581 [Paraglaciecola sp.]